MGNEIRLFYDLERGDLHSLSVTIDARGHKERFQTFYEPIKRTPQATRRDVSSPVSLFREQQQIISEQENDRLERCLSDALLCLMFPYLSEKGAVILIQGPPINKLVGRIAYRHPRSDLIIIFVTIDNRLFTGPKASPIGEQNWDGPFPDMQQDSMLRRFLYLGIPHVCVDIFSQGINQAASYAKDIDGTPLGLRAKLESTKDAILTFSRDMPKLTDPVRNPVVQILPYEEHQSEMDLAARSQSRNMSDDLGSIKMERSENRARSLADEEVFEGVLGSRVSKTGAGRFGELKTFFQNDSLGTFHEQVDFLRYIKTILASKNYSKSKVFSQSELRIWFREFHRELWH